MQNFGLKMKKLHQLGIIETLSTVQETVVTMSYMCRTCSDCKQKTFHATLDASVKGNIIASGERVTESVPIQKKWKRK